MESGEWLRVVCAQVEEGWWSGMFNGKAGLFPSNFVKELDATKEDGESSDTTADETGKTWMADIHPHSCEVCSLVGKWMPGMTLSDRWQQSKTKLSAGSVCCRGRAESFLF